MSRDFNPAWVEIEVRLEPDCGCVDPKKLQMLAEDYDPAKWAASAEAEAKAKKRVLDELRKYGLNFTETPYTRIDPASAELALRACRLQDKNHSMTFGEALRSVRAEKQAG